jgi:hypothetical protein
MAFVTCAPARGRDRNGRSAANRSATALGRCSGDTEIRYLNEALYGKEKSVRDKIRAEPIASALSRNRSPRRGKGAGRRVSLPSNNRREDSFIAGIETPNVVVVDVTKTFERLSYDDYARKCRGRFVQRESWRSFFCICIHVCLEDAPFSVATPIALIYWNNTSGVLASSKYCPAT